MKKFVKKEIPKEKRKTGVLLFFILILNLLLALLLFDPKLSTGGDNATYIVLAKSIISGKGFRDLSAPGEPFHTQYPFGYPLLLAPLLLLFPQNFIPLKFLSLLLGTGSLLLFFHLFKNRVEPFILIISLLLLALNPDLLEFSHWELSEIPYLFFSLLSLFLLIIGMTRNPSLNPTLLTGLVSMMLTYYIRSIGLALILAALVFLIYKRNFKLFFFLLFFAFLIAFPWFFRNQRINPGQNEYLSQFLMRDPYNPDAGLLSSAEFIERFFTNLKIYFFSVIPAITLPFFSSLLPSSFTLFLSLVVTGLILIGIYVLIKNRVGLTEFYLLFYLGIALIWPSVWSDRRFLIPVIPFLIFPFVLGIKTILGKMISHFWPILFVPLLSLLVLANLQVLLSQIPENLRLLSQYRKGEVMAGYSPDWFNYYKAAEWVKSNTLSSSIVMSRKPSLFFLRSERKGICYPFTSNPKQILSAIDEQGVSYVIVDSFRWTGTTRRYLIPAIERYPERFEIVYVTPEPKTYILKVKRG